MSNGTALAAQGQVKTIRDLLEKQKRQIALALPSHLSPDRLLRVVMTSIQRTPKLLECDQRSLLSAVFQAAQLGLEPDGALGLAYLLPYGKECQLIVGYKGLVALARRSGEISTIYARVVHERDEFSFEYGLSEQLRHVPSLEDDPGAMTHVYAVAKLKDGGVQYEVMSRREVEGIKVRSKSSKYGPWVTDYEEMAKKTVIRRLSKMLPASVELSRAVANDERAEAGLPQEIDEIEASAVPDEQAAGGGLDRLVDQERQKQLTGPA
jgi:recombination protein RecT